LEWPADVGGGVRFEVPGVEVAGRADQEEGDAVLDLRLCLIDGAGRLHAQKVGQIQANQPRRTGLEEAPPCRPATGGHLDISDMQHGNPPIQEPDARARALCRFKWCSGPCWKSR